jgi:hypothetical protein
LLCKRDAEPIEIAYPTIVLTYHESSDVTGVTLITDRDVTASNRVGAGKAMNPA